MAPIAAIIVCAWTARTVAAPTASTGTTDPAPAYPPAQASPPGSPAMPQAGDPADAAGPSGAPQVPDTEEPHASLVAHNLSQRSVWLPPGAVARAARPVAVSWAAGLILFIDAPFPIPQLGFTLGRNLGSWVMLDLALSVLYALGGAKLFLGRGDVVAYVAGRGGYFVSGTPVLLASIGMDVSRPDGTYAFIEAGPVWDRETAGTSDRRWTLNVLQLAYGIGKRY